MPENASCSPLRQRGSTAHKRERVNAPVLFLIFNRPDLTERAFASIREAQPRRLFVAADGPRPDWPTDADRCERARQIATEVDWDCDVRCLFRKSNLGCQRAASEAISWMFKTKQHGIVLEDDCVADLSFFAFCDEMLDRYAVYPEIGVITGSNFQNGIQRGDASYYFSKYNHCWGWATWKRAWDHFDFALATDSLTDEQIIQQFLCAESEVRYWKKIFQRVRDGKINSWAYRWTFTCWKHRMLTVTPQVNLVRNVGFGSDATNTKAKATQLSIPAHQWISTDRQPARTQSIAADAYVFQNVFHASLLARLKEAASNGIRCLGLLKR